VAELAERIKALKSAHTIDAAPERTAPRRIAAEEPVTARIRRRTAQEPAALPLAEPEPSASPAAVPPADSASAARAEEPPPAVIPLFPEGTPAAPPQPAYRQHAARARRQGDRQ